MGEHQAAGGTGCPGGEGWLLGGPSAAPGNSEEEEEEEEEEEVSKPPAESDAPRQASVDRHGVPRQPKRRHRRRPSKKKRRWKPYFKLSWEEKKQLDERESVRAAKTRAEMFAKGFTVAPYNTTQFLMEEHNQEEPDLNTGVCPKRVNKSDETSEEEELDEEDQDSGSDGMGGNGSEFLQRDFSETYEKYHAESLQNMTKQELIREYLELEKCLSRLEDEKNRLRGRLEGMKAARSADAAEIQMKEIEHEVELLKAENERLEKENEQYKQRCLENGE
ncbi:protein HEXIM1-like [Pristis pectinata]|uniref:protein HEXIM1-like n=1 Tax=Pristis pectinata TaxID=685728 RepID=UPI00223CD6E0|nr:protein HEXIM1-like [Pristis pectinata]